MVSYLYQAPSGVPGDVTRVDETSVEPAKLIAVSSVYAQAFGIPMVYNTGGISQWGGSNVAADFAGVLIREAPGISGNTLQGFDDTIPNPDQIQGMAVRGYVSVKCPTGTPARGGIVYIRTVAAMGKAVGDFEATSDPGNNVALSLTQASWAVDGKDADNNTEIRIAR
jgi:hypothetical protein